jgi:hypothetical protein
MHARQVQQGAHTTQFSDASNECVCRAGNAQRLKRKRPQEDHPGSFSFVTVKSGVSRRSINGRAEGRTLTMAD